MPTVERRVLVPQMPPVDAFATRVTVLMFTVVPDGKLMSPTTNGKVYGLLSFGGGRCRYPAHNGSSIRLQPTGRRSHGTLDVSSKVANTVDTPRGGRVNRQDACRMSPAKMG
jgi:hypothetical protein